jgi:hypothetical protein
VAVEGGAGDPGLGHDLSDRVLGLSQMRRIGQLVHIDPLRDDPDLPERVDLPVEILLAVETRAYPSSMASAHRKSDPHGLIGTS